MKLDILVQSGDVNFKKIIVKFYINTKYLK